MIVDYHEMSALVGVGKPGQPVTLNDLHKTAWRLYTGQVEVPRETPRPFIFRADRFNDTQWLFTVRAAQQFQSARHYQIDFDEGSRLQIECAVIPYIYQAGVNDKRGKRVTPPKEQWESAVSSLLERRGLQVDDLSFEKLGSVRIHHSDPGMPQLVATASCQVSDALAAATSWTQGVSKMRAYGQGLLTILPASPLKPIKLA